MFIFLGSIKFQRKLAPKYRDVRNKAGLLASRLNNNLSGILTIKSFTKEKWELNRLNKESLDYQRSNKAAIKLSSAFIPLIRFAILFAFIAILLIGGFQTWNKTLDVGTYSFLVFITQRLLWPLTTLGHVLDDFQRSMASIDRVIDLIDTPIKIKDGKIKIEPKDIKGEIIFNNVNFNYPGRDLTLKNINFKIENNSTLGIVGLTGSGKSTILNSISNLIKPKNGEVLFNNEKIHLSPTYMRAKLGISHVLERRRVFPFLTVKQNLLLGAWHGEAKMQKEKTLDEIYIIFPILADRSNQLANTMSGGEQQMLAIGRALMTNPRLLILDEATEGLAPLIRMEIWDCLKGLKSSGQSILVVDKNIEALTRFADRHYIIEKGRVVWTGDSTLLSSSKEVQHRFLGI